MGASAAPDQLYNAVVNRLKRQHSETGTFDPIDAAQRLAAPFTEVAFGMQPEDPEGFEALIKDPVGVVVEAEPEAASSASGDRRALVLWWWKRAPAATAWLPCARPSRMVISQHEVHFDASDADLLANVDASIRSVASTSMASSAGDRLARFMLLSSAGDVVVLQESWLKLCPKVGAGSTGCEFADGSGAARHASPPKFRVVSADGPDDRWATSRSDASVGAIADARANIAWAAAGFAWLALTSEGSVLAAASSVAESMAQLANIVPVPRMTVRSLTAESLGGTGAQWLAADAVTAFASTAWAGVLLLGLLALLSAFSPASALLWLRVRFSFQLTAVSAWMRASFRPRALRVLRRLTDKAARDWLLALAFAAWAVASVLSALVVDGVCARALVFGQHARERCDSSFGLWMPAVVGAGLSFAVVAAAAWWRMCVRRTALPVLDQPLAEARSRAWDASIVWRRANLLWMAAPAHEAAVGSFVQAWRQARGKVSEALQRVRAADREVFASFLRMGGSDGRVGSGAEEVTSALEAASRSLLAAAAESHRLPGETEQLLRAPAAVGTLADQVLRLRRQAASDGGQFMAAAVVGAVDKDPAWIATEPPVGARPETVRSIVADLKRSLQRAEEAAAQQLEKAEAVLAACQSVQCKSHRRRS
ncbi:hypothetical protein FNF28_04082 [Cafeteria roenbergensis]|uniref:Uncharacterized protein n=1 Tax=Cafeteria roenbergensis TaxID=33653 RepID=A0A5A8DF19_CAFRO|nr:hypothetical protein FNF28_04082 [Cafeteria roenbergensis]